MSERAFGQWTPQRPRTLVIACSDGRLQQATETSGSHAVTFRPLDAMRELEGSAWGEPFLRRRQ